MRLTTWATAWAIATILPHGTLAFRRPAPPLPADARNHPVKTGTFVQPISHDDPAPGKFNQRYWYSTEYYRGPGSPIILFTPGEVAAEAYQGYLTNNTLTGMYAQALGAAVILLEHRYWGNSSPYSVLDTVNLQHLTVRNAIGDLVNFARYVVLPFDAGGRANAPRVPWVLVGGSYSGALAAWTAQTNNGTFWAYHASSAPVQAIRDFWSYYIPVQQGMPHNCSADLERIAQHIDDVLDKGSRNEIRDLQRQFGALDLQPDDFASMYGNLLGQWQDLQEYSGYSNFFRMCDSIEGVRHVPKPISKMLEVDVRRLLSNDIVPSYGIGLDQALGNFAKWFRNDSLPGTCANYSYPDWQAKDSVACFDTYNATSPMYTDWTVNNTVGRQWMWMLCSEPLSYWQTGTPKERENGTTLVPRHVTPNYFERQCGLAFPPKDGYTFRQNKTEADLSIWSVRKNRTEADMNTWTRGWYPAAELNTRVIWVNGEYDPWRSASVSSDFRPLGPMARTPTMPVYVIPGGRHCTDFSATNGVLNIDVKTIQETLILQMKKLVLQFPRKVPMEEVKVDLGNDSKNNA